MDMLEDGARWLNEQRVKFLSSKVTYQRGSASVEVNATRGKTIFLLDTGTGVRERFETRDFLISASELVLNSVAVLPKRGDLVRETQGTTIFVYEVMAPGKEPEWRYSDTYRRTLRIHTKHVSTETAP